MKYYNLTKFLNCAIGGNCEIVENFLIGETFERSQFLKIFEFCNVSRIFNLAIFKIFEILQFLELGFLKFCKN